MRPSCNISVLAALGCVVAPARVLLAPGLVPVPRRVAVDPLRLAGVAADGDGEGVGLTSSVASSFEGSATGSSMRAPVEVTRRTPLPRCSVPFTVGVGGSGALASSGGAGVNDPPKVIR